MRSFCGFEVLIIASTLLFASSCWAQTTLISQRFEQYREAPQTAILSRIERTLSNVAVALFTSTSNIAKNVDNHAFLTAEMQSEVQKLNSVIGRLLTELQHSGNYSNAPATAGYGNDSLPQKIQRLIVVTSNISDRMKNVSDSLDVAFRMTESEGIARERRFIANVTAHVREACGLQNEIAQHNQTDQLLLQSSESLSVLQRLPDSLQPIIIAAYARGSEDVLNETRRHFNRYDEIYNQTKSTMVNHSVNYNRTMADMISLTTGVANGNTRLREMLANTFLQNERLLTKTDQLFLLLSNVSSTTLEIAKKAVPYQGSIAINREDSNASAYCLAQRVASMSTAGIRQQSERTIAEMRAFSEYLSPAASVTQPDGNSYTGCQDAFRGGIRQPNVYNIQLSNGLRFRAWCDFDGAGGWMVMHRRLDGTVDFFKSWREYEIGFGNLWAEHWLGLERVYYLTRRTISLSVYLEAFDNLSAWANYSSFQIGDSRSNYTLSINGYSGSAGDSLNYHNGHPFSTWDRDNERDSRHCANLYTGAWWYNGCHHSNLNGRYEKGLVQRSSTANSWSSFKGEHYGLKVTIIRLLV